MLPSFKSVSSFGSNRKFNLCVLNLNNGTILPQMLIYSIMKVNICEIMSYWQSSAIMKFNGWIEICDENASHESDPAEMRCIHCRHAVDASVCSWIACTRGFEYSPESCVNRWFLLFSHHCCTFQLDSGRLGHWERNLLKRYQHKISNNTQSY